MDQKIVNIQNQLKNDLNESRYIHTMGVMYTAASLAMCHGGDVQKALIAGLLHDCAKCIPFEEKFALCEKYQIKISPVERRNPELLHAKLGASIAADKYEIQDEDIINSIASHTTGRPEMSLLEKIVYISDYMEPGRKPLSNMGDVRRLAYQNIDECLYRILKDSLVYLKSRDMAIDPMTEKTYFYYREILGKED